MTQSYLFDDKSSKYLYKKNFSAAVQTIVYFEKMAKPSSALVIINTWVIITVLLDQNRMRLIEVSMGNER